VGAQASVAFSVRFLTNFPNNSDACFLKIRLRRYYIKEGLRDV